MNDSLPPLHADFIERVRGAVASDARLSALLAGGSWVHGGLDHHSDLDLVILVDDASHAEVTAERMAFAESLGGLLSAFTGEHVGEPRLLICLYGPRLLHVDLKFVTADDLDRRVERPAIVFARDPAAIERQLDAADIAWPDHPPEWFEQRAWIWLHYAATKLARGELLEAVAMLAYFRDQVLGPMLHRRGGRPQRGVRRLEQQAGGVEARLIATVTGHDVEALHTGLLSAIDLYVDLRRDQPPERPVAGMPDTLIAFLTDCS